MVTEKHVLTRIFPYGLSSSRSLSSTHDALKQPLQAGQIVCFFFAENAVLVFAKMAILVPYILVQELILISNFICLLTIILKCPYYVRFISVFHHKSRVLQSNFLSQMASQPESVLFFSFSALFPDIFETAGFASHSCDFSIFIMK